jgi:ferrous iron transport protein A
MKKLRGRCCMLDQLAAGKRARIRRHHGSGAIRHRLLSLGFMPDCQVDVVRRAPLGDPIQCRVANSCVTLRRSEARFIEVEEEPGLVLVGETLAESTSP